MACLTTLAPRDERAGHDGRADDIHSTGIRSMSPREVHIGRLDIEFVSPDRPFARSWKRVSSVHDASYLMVFPLAGCVTFSQDGRAGIGGPDEYVLLSELAFYQLSSDKGARLLLVRIPATISRRFKPNDQMTHLLAGMIRNVAELFIDQPPPNPQALATEIISFVALTIATEDRGAATDVRNARYHLRRRIVDFIEKNLSDQTLSPKKIAASSRISLSYLYSLFNDNETTVGQFVQVKRLQRAYEILVADPKGHRTVSEVAYEVGFKNVSHFSRSFSRYFKIAPRDVRQMNKAIHLEPNSRPSRLKTVLVPKAPSRSGFGSPHWGTSKPRLLHERSRSSADVAEHR